MRHAAHAEHCRRVVWQRRHHLLQRDDAGRAVREGHAMAASWEVLRDRALDHLQPRKAGLAAHGAVHELPLDVSTPAPATAGKQRRDHSERLTCIGLLTTLAKTATE